MDCLLRQAQQPSGYRPYNDEPRNPVIARWLLSEVEIHEAIQIESLVSGLLRSVRNDGDLYRHYSFLRGIYHVPGAYNDETRNSVIARWLLSEVEIHEAIQIEPYSSGLLPASCTSTSSVTTSQFAMTATCIVITLFCRGFFPCPVLAMKKFVTPSLRGGC